MSPPTPKSPRTDPQLLPRERFLEATKEYLSILTRPLIDMRTPKTGGKEFASTYSRMVDTIVGLLFQRAAEEQGLNADSTDIAVIAMGGYGRAELAPYSDVDLLIVCREKTPLVESIAGSFIRLMWDAGFELGHAVESLVESESALSRDMDTKTALIESRWVCGSKRVARAVERQISRIRRSDREEYLRRKIHDALARYEKFGNSFQLIEPNVKLSPGGLRDYQTLVWLGQVNQGTRGLSALRKKGLLLHGEQRELEEAYDYLLRVRIELHLSTRSKQDQLTIAAQRSLAKSLGYRARGGHLEVEFFMRRYYTVTRAIWRITADVMEALGYGDNVGIVLGRARVERDGKTLNARIDRAKIRREPLYVFERQKELGKKLDRGLRRRLEGVLREELRGRKEVNAMRRAFPRLLRDATNTALVVRSMHETLFLMRVIPEYDRLTCLKRYDLYHHYTVDEHSFKVLESLTALDAPDADPDDAFVRLYSEISDKRPLLFAALLHDIGKIEGHGHAKKGAALSRKILRRMSVGAEEIDLVSALIENHLVMSHFSQRRDPSDIGTIEAFCKRVKNRTVLKHLCLLTYADYKATSPLVWNEWKRTLLWELYLRAYDHMARTEKKPEAVYKAHKRKLLESFPEGRERAAALAHLDLLPGGYLLTMSADMVRGHMEMIESLERGDFAVAHRRRGAWSEVTFCTNDKPYRLSQLCGVLTINDFNILHAHAFTRSDGKVIDVFIVEHIPGTLAKNAVDEKLASIRRDLAGVFDGTVDLEAETRRHAARWRRARRPDIPMAVRVRFENDLSPDFTIIDIFAQDRPGLLFKITGALSRDGLTIFRANISTEATRVIDSFYVGDGEGKKINSAERLTRIRAALEREVG